MKIEPLIVNTDQAKVQAHITSCPTNVDDCLDSEQKQSIKGKKAVPYDTYNLYVKVEDRLMVLSNLFGRQLNALIQQYGENSRDWIGLPVEITGMKNGEYWNAVITPCKEFLEEELKEVTV